MKVNYAHLCDYASLSVDGKVSIMGVFGRILVRSIPAVHASSFLVFEVELDYTEMGHPFKARVECVDEDGSMILKAELEYETTGTARIGDHPLLPQVLRLPPLQFVKPGKHEVNIFLGSDPAAKWHVPLDVVVLPKPPELPPRQP